MLQERFIPGRAVRRARRAWSVLRTGRLPEWETPSAEDALGEVRARPPVAHELPAAGMLWRLATGRPAHEFAELTDAGEANAALTEAYESLSAMRALLTGQIAPGTPAFEEAVLELTSRRWPARSPILGLLLLGELTGESTAEHAVARVARRMALPIGIDLSYALLRSEAGRRLGQLAQGIVAIRRGLHDLAWAALTEAGDIALATAAGEYAESGLAVDPETALATLLIWLDDSERAPDVENEVRVLECLLSYGYLAEAVAGYAAVRERLRPVALDPESARRLEWLGQWCDPRRDRRAPAATSAGRAVSFGVIDYKSPDYRSASSNMGDYVQTLASLGHLLRHDVDIVDGIDPGVDYAVRRFKDRIAHHFRAEDPARGAVRLVKVNRDASLLDPIPEGTWMLAFGWYAWRSARAPYHFPFHPHVRPLFVSFHVEHLDMLTPEAYAYLRQYGPVGCRDWATVWFLLAAGVPAFFSGCLTTTVEGFWERDATRTPTGRVAYVDAPAGPDGVEHKQSGMVHRRRPFAWNLENAYQTLEDYRREYDRISTSRLHCYLPMTAIGADVDFTVGGRGDLRFEGLRGLGVAEARAMGARITALLEPVMGLILQGAGEDDVYAAWRRLTEPLVAEAQAAFDAPLRTIPPAFDVATAVREASSGVRLGGPDDRVDLVVAFDYGFRKPAEVSLTSIVTNSGRPIRLHVLARDLPAATRKRFERIFGEVDFCWYDMSAVHYGSISGMLKHISIATMDRLLLPDLLPSVERAVYVDLDTVTEGDVAELFELPLGDALIAARSSITHSLRSSLRTFASIARRLRADHVPHDEFVRRLARLHGRDGAAFNAGVLVLDLAGMRRTGFVQEYLGLVTEYGLNDQELLNLWAANRRRELPKEWNVYADQEIVEDAKLIHYAGSRKPWSSDLGPVGRHWRVWADQLAKRCAAAGEEGAAW